MKIDLERPELSASGYRFALIVSRWNGEFTSRLEAGAREALSKAGAVDGNVEAFRVPGAFELPLAALTAARTGRFDAVIALGVVIRGETPHFDYVAGEAATGLRQASMETGIPVLFGVITADTVEQTLARCADGEDNKGYEAAMSAIDMVNALNEIRRDRENVKAFPNVV